MPVSTTWVNPSAGGALDLATGAVLTETWCDGVASDLLRLGGTTGAVTQSFFSTSAVAASTTSSTLTLIPNISVGITTTGGFVLVFFGGGFAITAPAGTAAAFAIAIDGAMQPITSRISTPGSGMIFTVPGAFGSTPSAAGHTYQVAWSTTTGTLAVDTSCNYWMTVLEFKR